MQPRLMRSRTEVIVAGVCGGLAEYFAIDPVIVRLIFVLVTLTSGLGLLIYPILWLVMPKAGATGNGAFFPPDAEEWRRRAQTFGEEASQVGQQFSREVREVLRQGQGAASQGRTAAPPRYGDVPPPEAYRYDPITGQPINPTDPATGKTVNLRLDPTAPNLAVPPTQPNAYGPVPQRKRGRVFGFMLLGVGILILANIFNVGEYIFPLLLIGAGFMLLRKR
ncbi:MAG: PspC domain-containing protein [Chloroflexi bacterium SZAS-1]|jgi:phage shock protein C|nr:PspC domain-containing protein [Chloroflexi bacterium SZAS-1]HNP87078.1 PspC domain-containing protein [Kouleothrix sp.]